MPEEPTVPVGETPTETTFQDPQSQLSGDLKILLWSHFIPQHDEWFDPFAQEWGRMAGVNVTVDHVNNAEIPGRIAAEIAAGQGHDLIQYIGPLSQYEPSVLDLRDVTEEAVNRFGEQTELCVKSSFNPNTETLLRLLPGLRPRPGQLPEEPLGAGRHARWSFDLGPAARRGHGDQGPSSACRWASGCLRRSTPTWRPER